MMLNSLVWAYYEITSNASGIKEIDWTIEDYNPDVPGSYTAVGVAELSYTPIDIYPEYYYKPQTLTFTVVVEPAKQKRKALGKP